jgi:hypothetical protein
MRSSNATFCGPSTLVDRESAAGMMSEIGVGKISTRLAFSVDLQALFVRWDPIGKILSRLMIWTGSVLNPCPRLHHIPANPERYAWKAH